MRATIRLNAIKLTKGHGAVVIKMAMGHSVGLVLPLKCLLILLPNNIHVMHLECIIASE